MTLQKAALADYGAVLAFYDDVIERTPEIGRYARWQKGKHPTAEGIRSFIEEGSMYLYRERDIVGAMVVTLYQGEDYHAIEWLKDVADNEVAVIHLLAVSPDRQSEGIGSGMVMEAIRTARDHGMRSVRLDALSTNTPAHRIYEGLGFEYRGKQHLYAENTGWTDFYFYELNETKKIAQSVKSARPKLKRVLFIRGVSFAPECCVGPVCNCHSAWNESVIRYSDLSRKRAYRSASSR